MIVSSIFSSFLENLNMHSNDVIHNNLPMNWTEDAEIILYSFCFRMSDLYTM